MSIYELFEKHNDEYLKFERIEKPKSTRPDIHAFILLNELHPSSKDIVCAATHDKIWLDVESDGIEKLTEGNIIELLRCGVRYDSSIDSLCMFV